MCCQFYDGAWKCQATNVKYFFFPVSVARRIFLTTVEGTQRLHTSVSESLGVVYREANHPADVPG